ncbi:MAG: PG0541 family transporter-associated protein [Elusimicrobiota bacterium]
MKFLLIIYNAAVESQIIECMKECEIKTYTKFPGLHGVGTHSDPHLDTHVWPGVNNAFLIALDEQKINPLVEKVKKFKQEQLQEGVKAFVLPLERVI